MPTKRDLREQELENAKTQEIDTKEIQDYEDLDVPDFENTTPYRVIPQNEFEEGEDESSTFLEGKMPMVVGVIILVIFLIVICLVMIFNNISNDFKTEESIATATPTVETEEVSNTLDYYYLQCANTTIVSQLNEDYGTDYTKPSTDQYEISGSQDSPVIKFDLTVGDAYKKNYVMPAEFYLNWNSSESQYEITSYTVDETDAKESGWKSNSSKKEAKKQAEEVATEGNMVSSFDVTVRNSVTVSITAKGSGTVTAYAVSKEDGTKTTIVTTNGGTATQTVNLNAGDYTLELYAEDGTGYSWNYNLG